MRSQGYALLELLQPVSLGVDQLRCGSWGPASREKSTNEVHNEVIRTCACTCIKTYGMHAHARMYTQMGLAVYIHLLERHKYLLKDHRTLAEYGVISLFTCKSTAQLYVRM